MNDWITLYLDNMGITADSNIIIWGAGARGEQTLVTLNKFNISVMGFCDSNPVKQNNLVCGKPCFSPDKLFQIEHLMIIFSVDNCNEFFEEICQKYAKVIDSSQLKFLFFMPVDYKNFFPLGHFYSLYPNLEDVYKNEADLFDKSKEIRGIEFHEEQQVEILTEMSTFYETLPNWNKVGEPKAEAYRYQYLNSSFSPADTLTLHCMLRLLKPEKMIEVGSGWSSAATLDTNEHYLDHSVRLTFIEPYPTLLRSNLKESDDICLIPSKLQEVPLETFTQLKSGDILFIDSTHVSKIGSDVNYLFFEIFPCLEKGVYIHLHDIFFPFEYPKEWIENGMVWNELYLLRAFLMNNQDYEIVYFQNMMELKYKDIFKKNWPLEFPHHGGSIWLRKVE